MPAPLFDFLQSLHRWQTRWVPQTAPASLHWLCLPPHPQGRIPGLHWNLAPVTIGTGVVWASAVSTLE